MPRDSGRKRSRSPSIERPRRVKPPACSVSDAVALISPIHRRELTKKIQVQKEYFTCPAWIGSPKKGIHLEVNKGDSVKEPLRLDKFPYYLFGCHEFLCDFFLQHTTLSRIHCVFVHHASGACFLIDMQSRYGTFVNGKKLQPFKPTKLHVGDMLRMGQSTRKYYLRE
eukprot:TRINITY_DN68201_c5_g3_i4.p1 TRINITY_DN68201_c5_g3~~TRINITY_DN68201_c5_g3_i4.p1  ORF type:complete len:168 (-),score=0.82 TRINITY_DN68201_c5_g3_i4:330-833(-)